MVSRSRWAISSAVSNSAMVVLLVSSEKAMNQKWMCADGWCID